MKGKAWNGKDVVEIEVPDSSRIEGTIDEIMERFRANMAQAAASMERAAVTIQIVQAFAENNLECTRRISAVLRKTA